MDAVPVLLPLASWEAAVLLPHAAPPPSPPPGPSPWPEACAVRMGRSPMRCACVPREGSVQGSLPLPGRGQRQVFGGRRQVLRALWLSWCCRDALETWAEVCVWLPFCHSHKAAQGAAVQAATMMERFWAACAALSDAAAAPCSAVGHAAAAARVLLRAAAHTAPRGEAPHQGAQMCPWRNQGGAHQPVPHAAALAAGVALWQPAAAAAAVAAAAATPASLQLVRSCGEGVPADLPTRHAGAMPAPPPS
eukprot:1159622-Pelagomonas_calceolata.AAC.8